MTEKKTEKPAKKRAPKREERDLVATQEDFDQTERAHIHAFWGRVMRGEEHDRGEQAPTLHARLRASELLHNALAGKLADDEKARLEAELAKIDAESEESEVEAPKPTPALARVRLFEVKS